MNRLSSILTALATVTLMSVPANAMSLGEAYSEVEGYTCGGSQCTQDFAGTREQVDNVFVGFEASRVGMPIEPGSVLSCPWPTTSRWYSGDPANPGYMKNVNPVTCQSESLMHDDGGNAIYNRVVSTVNTVRTIVKEMYHDPESPFEEGWSVTVVSDTTVDTP